MAFFCWIRVIPVSSVHTLFRQAFQLVVILTFSLAFAGCSPRGRDAGGGGKDVSIFTMQLKPIYTEYMEGMFRAFEKQNPGVTVKWLDYPAQEYETKLLSLIASGNAPDVQNLPFEYMLHLHDRGLLLNLDDRLSSETKAMYVEAVMKKGCSIGGGLYAVPWYLATAVTMYNKDIFREAGLDPEKPPLTNEELFAAARQIKARTNKFGFLSTFSEDGNLKMLLAQAGIPLTDETKKKAIFNTPEAAALVREYKSLFDEGVIPRESATAEHRRALELYKGGKTAIFQSGPQFLLIIRNEAPDVYAVTGVGPTMAVPGTGEYGVDTQNLAIFAKTKNPNEAVDLALWVTNAENQLAFSKLVTIFPSVKSALADPYFTDTGLTDPEGLSRVVAARQLEHATVLVPPLPRLPEINKVLNDTMQKIMLKDEPVEKALSEAEAKCTDILAK